MPRWTGKDDFDSAAEEFDRSPAAGWVYGILVAGMMAGYGLLVLISGEGWFFSLRGAREKVFGGLLMRVDGGAAVWLGVLMIGCGLMLHFHSFWGTQRTLSRYHEPVWYAALCVTLVAAALFAYHVVLRP